MQNKGFVKVFAVLLTLVCLFYLSFSVVTNHYNNKAAEFAAGDPAKESHYLDSLSTQKVWLGYTLKECREMEIGLGLDLKGGMNVVLELSVPDVVRSLSNNNQDENFNKALDLAYADQATSQKNFIDLFAEEYQKLVPGGRLASIFSTFELKDKITPQSSDAEVISVLKSELQSAIDNSFNVLRTRIDRFGVLSPNIQRLETAGRILVELPGVKEPERVRKLLQGSANLEFWETYKLPEIYQNLIAADNVLAKMLADAAPADSTAEVAADTKAAETEATQPAAATNEADSLLADLQQEQPEGQSQSEEDFAKQHPLFSLLMINQYNGQLVPSAVVGMAEAKDMEKINEYLNMKQVKDVLPRNLSLKWGVKAVDERERFYELYAIKVTNRDGTPALGGDVVTDANADFVQQAGISEQQVSMTMNAEGAKAWARLTKENIGRAIAIVLDGLVYSAPNVNDEITGGRSSITGNFTPEEAKDLANVLNSGKMAASVHIVQEDVVGPSLGQEAITAGFISFLIALILLEYSLYSIHHRFQMEKRNAQLRKLFMALYRHDMKMPIAAIVNRVFVLEEKGKEQRPGETQEELEGIKKAVKRLRDEVVELAAVQACEQDVKVDFEDVDINEVVRKVVEAAQPHEPGRKEPRVEMALKAENATVRGNRELLQSIIQNLVEVEVADKGEGIAKGELRHIFKPRYRTKNAQKGKAGTGMGLFLAYANTKMHGGDIGVESELGKGSRFHVELPLKRMA